ncbi:GNAT family N-acetyltransferase [Kitasatospora sp. NPDC058965]|uniref:GNAT family N-acetyltransferase n=1 Tax=Kitasatospora sp. NPDC058965 TaxID=3346682 RepID=UPI00368DD01D
MNDHVAGPRRYTFADKPPLTGSQVTLRPFRIDEDADAVRDWLTDPESLQFTDGRRPDGTPVAWTDEDEQRMRAWYATRAEQPDRLDYAVVDRATGRCVGEAVLNQWEPDRRSCSFRIALAAAGRGRGLGTEAVRLLVGHGFEELDLHRIALSVYAFNPRARRCYEKAGFVLEGTRRQVLPFGEEWVDDLDMAILAPEWAVHRGHPDGGAR